MLIKVILPIYSVVVLTNIHQRRNSWKKERKLENIHASCGHEKK